MSPLIFSRKIMLLVIGDIVSYVFSLILTLTIRYGEVPDRALFMSHIGSFSILFIIFLLVGFSAGIYDKQTGLIRGRIQGLLVRVQVVNFVIGIIFFYFAPVAIAPKANLFIYFAISTSLMLIWRTIMAPVLSRTRKQSAVLVGMGDDIQDLYDEVGSGDYGIAFKDRVEPHGSIQELVASIATTTCATESTIIVADLNNQSIQAAMPFLYSIIFSGVLVIDAAKLYESVFDRIPLSIVGERWLVEHSTAAVGSRRTYDVLKRLMDIVVAGAVGLVSLIVYPLVYIAIKLDDGGRAFVTQERIGKNGKLIRMTKFRSMTADDSGAYGDSGGKTTLKVTRVGRLIRMTRIDELPQLWSVIKGDQSLIGPRPELPALAAVYEKEVPYYNARHLIKPGLSGWAQIYHRAHPHHAVAIDDTCDKLSYDLYYVKHRSFALDIRIALQTAKAILSKQGV